MKKFVKGMVKDPERVDQPESTYRDALNASLYYQKGAIVNEHGNKVVANVSPAIVNIIGQCPLEDGRIVLFAKDETSDVISLLSPKDQEYTVLYRNPALNYQPEYTIEATAKVDTQGDILVYFTDDYLVRNVEGNSQIQYISDYNPPRVFNVTKQVSLLSAGETALYGNQEYTIDKLDLFLNTGLIPQFDEVKIEDGGGVVSGTYHLALAYSDEDGNTTNFMVTSNAVHLVTAPENTIPTEIITGDPQGSQSKKSITWEVIIPEQVNYSHIKPVVIQRFGGLNQESSEFAYQLADVKIPNYSGESRVINITYTGLETIAAEDVNAVVIDNVRYESAKTLVQLNNRLYISNLKSRGDIGYQRFANSIQLSAVKEKIERFDPRYYDLISLNQGYSWFKRSNSENIINSSTSYEIDDRFTEYASIQKKNQSDLSEDQVAKFYSNVRKGYKDPKLFYKKKSYRRSEVYAFYISFVLKDGTETYAYHIPGREALEIFSDYGWAEDTIIPDGAEAPGVTAFDTNEVPNNLQDSRFYQVYDTQVMLSEYANTEVSTGFWENRNELYPDTENFSVWSTNNTGIPVPNGDIKGQNVRHHKMPSNKHNSWKFIGDYTNTIGNISPSIYNNPPVSENQELNMTEDINILGIKLSNIRIPKFILNQVQGYKIYYAKRTQQNKTIVGQSVVVPAAFRGVTALSMDTTLAAQSQRHRAWYMYGSIPSSLADYVKVNRPGKEYRAISVFGFHDFNMLKNRHTLSGSSHIDVQSILVMKHYRGGPNIKEDTTSDYKKFYFPDWLSSEVQNIVDLEAEDGVDVSNALSIKAFVTSAMLASAYFRPGDLTSVAGFQTPSSENGNLSNTNTVFTIKADSLTYLPGHLHLKTSSGTEFHGADYLLNFGGESEIAVGLSTGLPMLKGWAANNEDIDVFTRLSWYTPNGYLNAVSGEAYHENYTLNLGSPYVGSSAEGQPKLGGWPAVYLVNLCNFKSDVYKSFDEQQLVWTGYYKDLSKVDINTGRDVSGESYYQGAASDSVFGGDTYISRYSFRSTSLSYGHSFFDWFDIPFNEETGETAGFNVAPNQNAGILGILTNMTNDELENALYIDNNGNFEDGVTYWSVPEAWRRGNNTPISTLFYFFCESDDLLGFRYSGDQTRGVTTEKSLFFDGATASDVIFNSPINDNTHMDNLLYMNNYSLNQDIRVALPFPKKLNDVTVFPTRTIRSMDDEGSINDKYRFFQALEFKDIPRNRGDIFKLFTLGAILYIHTERSLFVTRGKQSLQLGDNTQAYVGSGNIFEQDPDEMVPTTQGYGGCDTQFTALTTRYGQFFVNRRDKKAYMLGESIMEISSLGMEKWFLDNVPFRLEELGFDLQQAGFELDSPTAEFGFVATYDPRFKRIILTKREKIPTAQFNQDLSNGLIELQGNTFYNKRTEKVINLNDETFFVDGGWTLSYYPEIQAWGSKHSYIPRLYASTAEDFYSLVNYSDVEENQVWEHSDINKPGSFFGELYPFEFEYIDNTAPGAAKVFSNIYYLADVTRIDSVNYKESFSRTSTGFNDFYVYTKQQVSGLPTRINYLSNARRVDKIWYINDFRDMSRTYSLTNDELVTGIPNVAGDFTSEVVNSSDSITMFTSEGSVNPNFVNPNKSWFERKRFVDHYLGVRLISDNSTNSLIYLYAAGTKHRQSFR